MGGERPRRVSRLVSATLALTSLLPPPSSAQEGASARSTRATEPPSQLTPPPRMTARKISLAEAVGLTLLHNPQIELARQEVTLASGALQEESGFFDHALRVAPAYRHAKSEILPFLRKRERDNRDRLEALATGFGELAARLQKALEESRNPPPCPEGVDFDNVIIVTGLEDVVELEEICIPRDLTTTRRILEALGTTTSIPLGETLNNLLQLQRDQLTLRKEIAETVSTRSQLSLDRLGEMPQDEVIKTLSFDFAYSIPFRSGMTFRGDLRLQSEEDNFRDKPLDPAFGGLGTPIRFPSFLRLSLDVPLGKGRGSVSAAAPESAAAQNLEAQRERLRHTISEEVFRTVLAYVNLLAAQETLRLLEESASTTERFVDLTEQLIEANETARIELSRARARAAFVQDTVLQGRLAVLEARFALAEAMGLSVDSLEHAPLAADTLPAELDSGWTAHTLVQQALTRRRDLKAVGRLRDATRTLADAARADLKRRVDFSVSAGMSTFYESPFFRYLPDELRSLPSDSPIHLYSPRGYWRMLQGDWKPFLMAGLIFDVPFKNNQAGGRLVQEQSSFTRTEIDVKNLERTIQDNIVRLVGALERAVAVVDSRRRSIQYFEQALDASLQRFQAGDITLLDSLLTEQDLTRERTQWVQAVEVYLGLLARLKFEVADLVRFRGEGTPSESVEFVVHDLVAGGKS